MSGHSGPRWCCFQCLESTTFRQIMGTTWWIHQPPTQHGPTWHPPRSRFRLTATRRSYDGWTDPWGCFLSGPQGVGKNKRRNLLQKCKIDCNMTRLLNIIFDTTLEMTLVIDMFCNLSVTDFKACSKNFPDCHLKSFNCRLLLFYKPTTATRWKKVPQIRTVWSRRNQATEFNFFWNCMNKDEFVSSFSIFLSIKLLQRFWKIIISCDHFLVPINFLSFLVKEVKQVKPFNLFFSYPAPLKAIGNAILESCSPQGLWFRSSHAAEVPCLILSKFCFLQLQKPFWSTNYALCAGRGKLSRHNHPLQNRWTWIRMGQLASIWSGDY